MGGAGTSWPPVLVVVVVPPVLPVLPVLPELPDVDELVLLDVDEEVEPPDPPVEVVVVLTPPVVVEVVVVEPPVVVVVEPPVVVVELCGLSGLPPVLVDPPDEEELDEDELEDDELDEELDPPVLVDEEVDPPEVEVEPPEVEVEVEPPEVVVETTTLPPPELPPPKKPPKKPPPKPPYPPPPITTGVEPPPPPTIGWGGGGGTYCGTAATATSGSQHGAFWITRRIRLVLRGAWRTTRFTCGRLTCLTCLTLRYSVLAAAGSATWTAPPPTTAQPAAQADSFARAIRTDISVALFRGRAMRGNRVCPAISHTPYAANNAGSS
jgi:hypothetical protein